jgi:hypothetical protein
MNAGAAPCVTLASATLIASRQMGEVVIAK